LRQIRIFHGDSSDVEKKTNEWLRGEPKDAKFEGTTQTADTGSHVPLFIAIVYSFEVAPGAA